MADTIVEAVTKEGLIAYDDERKQANDRAYEAKGAAADVIGTAADNSSANTVYGAKKKAEEEASAVLGSNADEVGAATVYGALKKANAAYDLAGEIPDDVVTESELTQKGYQTQSQVNQLIVEKGYLTETQINTAIAAAVAASQHLKKTVVTTLPATGEDNILYLVPDDKGKSNKDMYIWDGNQYVLVGNTETDLSGYLAKSDVTVASAAACRAIVTPSS